MAEVSVRRETVLREIFDRAPDLGRALDDARGPCLKFQGIHPSGRRCNKKQCPFLHVKKGLELKLAKNRLRSPFLHLTRDNKLLVVPPLRKAVHYWWTHTLHQETDCPIIDADVLREGESLVVLFTLSKPEPSSFAQDSKGKSWIKLEDGNVINASTVEIPADRTWWHATTIELIGDIVRDSLQTGPDGTFKAVYSFADWKNCEAYGGQVMFAFRSDGMVTKLAKGCNTPEVIPKGVIGYFDSSKKRQWLHNPENIQLTYARVEFHTCCTFFSEAFANLADEHHYSPELHTALTNIVGLVVPSIPDEG